MKAMGKLVFIIGILLLPLIILGQPKNNTGILTGENIKAIVDDSLPRGKLVVQVNRNYPKKVDPVYGFTLDELYESYEQVFIFADGEVFSKRDYTPTGAQKLVSKGYKFDETFTPMGRSEKMRARFARFSLSDDHLDEMLLILGSIEGELLPGEFIWGHKFYAEIRITYNGREGRLLEPIAARIGSEDNLAFINSFIDRIREIEWESDITAYEEGFIADLRAKQEEYGWYHESKLRGIEHISPQAAWEAHSLEIPGE